MASWTDDWADDARAEYVQAVGHYLDIDTRLADDLAVGVDRAIDLILKNRGIGAPYIAGTRRKLLGRFPFGIVSIRSARLLRWWRLSTSAAGRGIGEAVCNEDPQPVRVAIERRHTG